MSTRVNTYVMVGALFPYDALKGAYDRLEPYMDSPFTMNIEHREGLCVLYDGMNGEYVAIGRVLEKTGNHDFFEYPIRIAPLGDTERQSLHDDIRRLIQLEGDFSVQHLVISHFR
jgi:hypothetical protein